MEDFREPSKKGFTIYSKSGCPNCVKVKTLLQNKNYIVIPVNCDDFLIEQKDEFLSKMKELTAVEVLLFPLVFYEGKYVGGYKETTYFIEKLDIFMKDEFSF